MATTFHGFSHGGDIRGQDIMKKRANFMDRSNQLLQEFYFAHPVTTAELIRIYNTHFYESVLWGASTKEVNKLEKSWNVSIRQDLVFSVKLHLAFSPCPFGPIS